MDGSSKSGTDSDISMITALREAWLAAVKVGDAETLAGMLTDDVVVVHGDGRCVCGKEAVRADFLRRLQAICNRPASLIDRSSCS